MNQTNSKELQAAFRPWRLIMTAINAAGTGLLIALFLLINLLFAILFLFKGLWVLSITKILVSVLCFAVVLPVLHLYFAYQYGISIVLHDSYTTTLKPILSKALVPVLNKLTQKIDRGEFKQEDKKGIGHFMGTQLVKGIGKVPRIIETLIVYIISSSIFLNSFVILLFNETQGMKEEDQAYINKSLSEKFLHIFEQQMHEHYDPSFFWLLWLLPFNSGLLYYFHYYYFL